jgi:hypothetical protein
VAWPGACGGLFERPFVSWRDDVTLFLGPRLAGYSAVDVEDQTEVEIRLHRLMAQASVYEGRRRAWRTLKAFSSSVNQDK